MHRHRGYDNEHNNAINEAAEVRIRELELEIAQMRQNLAAYGGSSSEFQSSSEDADIVDVFSEWRKNKAQAESETTSAAAAKNIRRTYEYTQQDFEDLNKYLRTEHQTQQRKRLKPVWVVVALLAVMSAAAFGIGKWAGTETMAQQDSTLTVIESTVVAEQTTVHTAEQTTVTAEKTTVVSSASSVEVTTAPQTTLVIPETPTATGNEFTVVGAANTGTSQEPNTSMVAIGKKIVYIDPGHGGNDHGCVYGGVSEKDVDLEISMLLGAALEDMGYEVVYTREHDEYFSLSKRAKFANDCKADIFVSIHCNAYEDASVNGFDVYYNKIASADALAEQVFNSMEDKLDARARSYTYGSYQVLRQSKMPGILIEMGFLSNAEERKNLCDEEYQSLAAAAIAEALHEYFAAQEADE